MKRITIFLLVVALAAGIAGAKNWCEILIGNLNTKSDVDKTVAVRRAPETHDITNATYDFRFSSSKLYRQIYNTLKWHTAESDYYSESGGKYKNIVLRFTDNGRVWSCRLQNDRSNKQFLVSVKSDAPGTEGVIFTDEIEDIRSQATESLREAQRQAMEARKEARRQREEARRQVNEALKEARRQADEARRETQRQATEARKEAQRQREEAQRQVNAARRNHSGSSTTTIVNARTPEQQAELKKHESELQKAEAERKQKLGL